jgi:hypothetical protein
VQGGAFVRVIPNSLAPSSSPLPSRSSSIWSPLVIGCIAGGAVVLIIGLILLVMLSRRRAQRKRVQGVLGKREDEHNADIPGSPSAHSNQLSSTVSPLRGGVFGPSDGFVETTIEGSSPFSTQKQKDKVAMNPILSLSQESSARAASARTTLSQSTLYRGKALPKTALRRGQLRAGPDGSSSGLGAPASSGTFVEGSAGYIEPTVNPLLAMRLTVPVTYTTIAVAHPLSVASDATDNMEPSEHKESPKLRSPLSSFSASS